MEKDECYFLGAISKTHGLNGNVTVHIDAEDPEDYNEMESVFLEIQGKLVPFFISSIKINANGSSNVKFDFIDTIDEAKEIVGCKLFLPLDCLPELDDNDFYFRHIIGFIAIDEVHGTLGPIEDIIEYSKNSLFKILHKGEELLVPIADDFIIAIDKDARTITLATPEGLLDLNS